MKKCKHGNFSETLQGKKVLRDFNIAKEANGTGRAITKSYNASVTNNTLEIHFQWAGKGTMAIPHRSVYGPLISAISVTSSKPPENFAIHLSFLFFTYGTVWLHLLPVDSRPDHDNKLSTGAILGIVAAACVLIALISIFIWSFWRRKNAKNSGEMIK